MCIFFTKYLYVKYFFYILDPDTGLCDDISGRGHLLANLQFREGRLCCGKYKVRLTLEI